MRKDLHEIDIEAVRPYQTSPALHILICPDRPQWAFDNIANNIATFAGPNRLSKLYMRDVLNNDHLFFEALLSKRIDLCHVFWREDLFYLLHPRTIANSAAHLNLDYRTMVKAINNCAFTTSVYDHLFSSADDIQERRDRFSLIDGYTVSSSKLHTVYSSQPDFPQPDAVITDGVDTKHFSPAAEKKSKSLTLKIGWAGNSGWGNQSSILDVKGYKRLFEPLVAELQQRGVAIECKVADPQIERIPFAQMPDFYRDLDVFVCTSSMEGTPNTVLEAMSCGIPVVSTDVGIVPMAFGPLQRQFIIGLPTPGNLADAVFDLLSNPDLRSKISEENRRVALNWSWELKTRDWWPFWENTVRQSMSGRSAIRREMYLLSQL